MMALLSQPERYEEWCSMALPPNTRAATLKHRGLHLVILVVMLAFVCGGGVATADSFTCLGGYTCTYDYSLSRYDRGPSEKEGHWGLYLVTPSIYEVDGYTYWGPQEVQKVSDIPNRVAINPTNLAPPAKRGGVSLWLDRSYGAIRRWIGDKLYEQNGARPKNRDRLIAVGVRGSPAFVGLEFALPSDRGGSGLGFGFTSTASIDEWISVGYNSEVLWSINLLDVEPGLEYYGAIPWSAFADSLSVGTLQFTLHATSDDYVEVAFLDYPREADGAVPEPAAMTLVVTIAIGWSVRRKLSA